MAATESGKGEEQRIFMMICAKGSFSKAEYDKLKKEFEDVGIRLIVVAHNNNAPYSPKFDWVNVP
jgi:hypothetical protein